MRRALLISLLGLVVVGLYVLLERGESVTITVTDVYATDSKGSHPLPEEQQRPETITTRWVVADNGLTYQARSGRFAVGRKYTCDVATPDSGIELRACKAA